MGYLDRYIPLVEFLGQALGERCEVVLHDLTVPEKSIIAIANGNISGRAVGGSVTDFLLKLLQRRKRACKLSRQLSRQGAKWPCLPVFELLYSE